MIAIQGHPDVAKKFSIHTAKNDLGSQDLARGQRPASRHFFQARLFHFYEIDSSRMCHISHHYQVR